MRHIAVLGLIFLSGAFFVGQNVYAVGYIKYGGVDGETNIESSSTLQLQTPASSSSDTLEDDGENAANPALLEIDTIRGESPESSSTNSSDRLQDGGSANDWLISISSVEVRGWDPEKKEEFVASVKTAAEIESGQDLENFATGILLEDENVRSIEMNEERIGILYKMPSRFLGIFGGSLNMQLEVGRDGAVEVKLPWYSFLFRKLVLVNDIKSDMEANLPEMDDEVLVLFETQARTMMTMSDILKTRHDTVKNSIGNMR